MPLKRRKIPPTRINRPVPEWARRLLAGELPERDSEAEYAYVAWLYFGDEVPGLPLADSPEGSKLWYEATHAGQAS